MLIALTFMTCLAMNAEDFPALRDGYLAKFKPLWMEASKAWWEANTTGDNQAFARKKTAEKALTELHSDKQTFEKFKVLKDSSKISEPVQARELDVIYRAYLGGQGDPELQKRII